MAKDTAVSQRTKELLAGSLRRQMENKPLSRIKVSDIVRDTGVNRKTFYYHFEDIYALLRWMLEQETMQVIKNYDLLMDFPEVTQFIVQYVKNNRHILNCAYDAMGREGLRRFFYDDTVHIIGRAIDSTCDAMGIQAEPEYRRFLNELYTEALSGLLTSLIRDPHSLPEEKLLRYFEEYVRRTIPAALLPAK